MDMLGRGSGSLHKLVRYTNKALPPKFKQYFNDMFAQHQELFLRFKLLNDDYARDRRTYQAEFNQVGAEVVKIIEECESRLCGHMERGKNAVFSGKLAEKYRGEVRKYFSMIDFVGVKVS